jgi:hypothetical protein
MWVIVSGVPLSATSSSSSVSKVLMRMQAFGTVLAHSVSAGNWMFVKYVRVFELYLDALIILFVLLVILMSVPYPFL